MSVLPRDPARHQLYDNQLLDNIYVFSVILYLAIFHVSDWAHDCLALDLAMPVFP
jgi:hypothetical protein